MLHTGGSQVFNKKQKCSMGAQCPFAHSEEAWLCKNFIRLPRNFLKKMTHKGIFISKTPKFFVSSPHFGFGIGLSIEAATRNRTWLHLQLGSLLKVCFSSGRWNTAWAQRLHVISMARYPTWCMNGLTHCRGLCCFTGREIMDTWG